MSVFCCTPRGTAYGLTLAATSSASSSRNSSLVLFDPFYTAAGHAGQSCKRVLIGNKCDVGDVRRAVQHTEADAFAQVQVGDVAFFETSAKNGYNVEQGVASV